MGTTGTGKPASRQRSVGHLGGVKSIYNLRPEGSVQGIDVLKSDHFYGTVDGLQYIYKLGQVTSCARDDR